MSRNALKQWQGSIKGHRNDLLADVRTELRQILRDYEGALNAHLASFAGKDHDPKTCVPCSWWEGRKQAIVSAIRHFGGRSR